QKFSDIGSGDNNAFIDSKSVRTEPCFAGEICGRLSRCDALFKQVRDHFALAHRQTRIEPGFQLIYRQRQSMQDQISSLIQRIGCAVTEDATRASKLAYAVT